MGRLSGVAAGVAACVVLTGCGERSEPLGPQASLFPVTVVGEGGEPTTVAAPVRRIALAAPSPGHLLAALAADSIVSVFDANGRIGPGRLRRARPDLIVAGDATDPLELERAERRARVPAYVMPEDTIDEVQRAAVDLGVLLAIPDRAREIARGIQLSRDDVRRRLAGRPRVSVFVDLGGFTTANDRSLVGDMIREAGGRNVFADAEPGPPVDLAELERLDPDVYVVRTAARRAAVLASPRTQSLRAVRERRVVVFSGFVPGPHIGGALEQLAMALHPDAYR